MRWNPIEWNGRRWGERILTLGAIGVLSVSLASAQMQQPGGGQMPSQPAGQMRGQPASPQQPGAPIPGENSQTAASQQFPNLDNVFLAGAIQANLGQIELAKLALEKSGNDQVKQFAQQVMTDDSKLNSQMEPLAQSMQIAIPKDPSRGDRGKIGKLRKLSGAAFDKAYLKDEAADHKGELQDYRQEASAGHNAKIKAIAAQAAPAIGEHLQLVKNLQKNG